MPGFRVHVTTYGLKSTVIEGRRAKMPPDLTRAREEPQTTRLRPKCLVLRRDMLSSVPSRIQSEMHRHRPTPPSQEFQKSSMSQASTYERHSVAALGSDQR